MIGGKPAMGIPVSLLGAGSALFVGALCFAAGYLLAANSLRKILNYADDDDNEDQKTWTIHRARQLLYFVKDVVRARSCDKRTLVDRKRKSKKSTFLEIESLAAILEDFKMVLVVRNDLKMGKGKIAAQCSHATLGMYKKLHNRAPKALNRWEQCGQVKVVLRTESEEDMLVLQGKAESLKLPTHITIDAGRTQIAPNSRTVMAILGPADVVDEVTGGLKLL